MRELGDRDNEGTALSTLGTIYTALSRYDEAIECLKQEIAIYGDLGNLEYQRYPLHNLGDAYMRLGRYDEALKYAEQALSLHREAKDRFAEAATMGTLGEVYSLLGRYDLAVVTNEQELQSRREAKDRHGEAHSLNNLGQTWRLMGRPEKAIEYFEQSLAIYREVKDRLNEATTLANLGMVYSGQARYEKAIDHFYHSLRISREVKSPSDEAEALKSLGLAYSRLNRHDQALASLEQALSINREINAREKEGETLIYLGNVHYSRARYEKAKECYELALAIHRESQSRANEAEALHGLAGVERDRGNLDLARALIEETLKITESLRASIYNQETRAAYFASVQGYNEFYIDLLMRMDRARPARGFDATAVEASERARARSLLELLTEAGADIRQGVDQSLLDRERSLARQINARTQQLAQRPKPEQAAALKSEISRLEEEYQQAQTAIRRASPRYAALAQPQPLTLTEIQQQLDERTLLLEYALGAERSYLWAIASDTLDSYELPGREQIEQAARRVYDLLVARGRRLRGETLRQARDRIARADAQLPQMARQLSRILLSPVAAKLRDNRLVVVADGALQYLPFAMLPAPDTERRRDGGTERQSDRATERRRGRETEREPSPRPYVSPSLRHFMPLVVKHEVISLPSASALAAHRRELAGREPAPHGVAVIADPVFSAGDERMKTATAKIAAETPPTGEEQSIYSTRIIEHLAEDSAKTASGRLVIPRLPYTRQEADRILAVAPGSTNLKALDFKADRATATGEELSRYRYVHFATHGLLDSERPGLSALALSLVDEQGKPQDGFLLAHEIYNLNLPAELVTLSACQTGLGKEIKGEGLVGLTRGFMYAGAARVVVSLWNVNDKATSELMAKFYQRTFKEGERPAAALRSAQVEMWRSSQWRAPYFWAAFVLQGEWK
jgi:CHAT domain-containing protein/tetratricopeptide (TPR) repeat protein